MKKTIVVALSVALVVLIGIFGSLAYFTDAEAATNVFTDGNVDIELTEDFEQGVELLPNKKIEKVPVITNTGKSNAYVWLTFSIPSALDNWAPGTEEGSNNNIIHWNPLGATTEGGDPIYVNDTRVNNAIAKGLLPEGITAADILEKNMTWDVFNTLWDGYNCKTETINGMEYNTYVIAYNKALAPGETTLPSLYQIFMDERVDMDEQGNLILVSYDKATEELNKEAIDWNMNTDGTPVLYVNAYGIQADTFASVDDAFNAYVGQWGGLNGDKAVVVESAKELEKALQDGGAIALASDMELEDKTFTIAKDTVLDLNGFDIEGVGTSASASKLFEVKSGTSLTLTGDGTIEYTATTPDTDWGDNNASRPYPGYANNTIVNRGSLVVDGVTLINNTSKGGASYVIDCYAGSSLTVNSGEIIQAGKDVAIRMFNGNSNDPAQAINVTINGGTISGHRAVWVQLASNNAAYAPYMNLTVNGGNLISVDPNYQQVIYSYTYGNSFANTKVALNGGTYYGDVAFTGGTLKTPKETVTVNAENCNFYGDVFRYSLATDADVVEEDGDYIYYFTKAVGTAAITAEQLATALKDGKDVALVNDVDAGGQVFVNKGSTLDGNGNTIVVDSGSAAYESGLTVSEGTVKNITVTGAFRGLGVGGSGASSMTGDATYENVVVEGATYGINIGVGNGHKITMNNCTLGDWNSYSGLSSAQFTGCTFTSEGRWYAAQRISANATFTYTNCEFNQNTYDNANGTENYYLDSYGNGTIILENCTVNGVKVTSANVESLFNIDKVTVIVK